MLQAREGTEVSTRFRWEKLEEGDQLEHLYVEVVIILKLI
jgi:hypothetical protein